MAIHETMTKAFSRVKSEDSHQGLDQGCRSVGSQRKAISMERQGRKRNYGWRGVGRSALVVSALIGGVTEVRATEVSILLGVEHDGKQEPAWIEAVSEHLGHNGEIVVANQRLTAKDRACKGPECLDALAAREHASFILSLAVQSNSPGTYIISGTLYDAVRHLPYQPSRPDVCDCSTDDLVSRLGQVADTLFREYRKRPTSTALVATEPATPPATNKVEPTEQLKPTTTPSFSLTPTRKVWAGVFGGGAAVTLATAIGLTLLDGASTSPCDSNRAMPRCVWDTRGAYGTLYGATAALVVGFGLTLFLPGSKPPSPPPTLNSYPTTPAVQEGN